MYPPQPPHKKAEWARKAAKKQAIVPEYFEVFPSKVIIVCGKCERQFSRNLIPQLDEPTFVCPNEECRARNWVPVRYQRP